MPAPFRYVARGGPLVVAFLMCLGVLLLPLPATASEVFSTLAKGNLPRVDLETNRNAPPLDESYLLALGEEAENADKHQLNTQLLTMILLAVCFGATVGWLLRNTQWQGAPMAIVINRRTRHLDIAELVRTALPVRALREIGPICERPSGQVLEKMEER
jgi:hypothetical protein